MRIDHARTGRRGWALAGMFVLLFAGITIIGCESTKPAGSEPRVTASSQVAVGKYLVTIAGCNDCHTPGFMQDGMKIPEDIWLTGSPIGFRGQWGTTYPSNLRIYLSKFNEDVFISTMRARQARPPMPWPALHEMNEQDLRAIFAYIRSLPVKGDTMPEFVPAGVEPKTPYFIFDPQMPKGTAMAQ